MIETVWLISHSFRFFLSYLGLRFWVWIRRIWTWIRRTFRTTGIRRTVWIRFFLDLLLFFIVFRDICLFFCILHSFLFILDNLLRITTRSIIDYSPFVVRIQDFGLWCFCACFYLQHHFLFVLHCSAWTVSVSRLILTFVC